jgi:hypothetical protein
MNSSNLPSNPTSSTSIGNQSDSPSYYDSTDQEKTDVDLEHNAAEAARAGSKSQAHNGRAKALFIKEGPLRPFRLLKTDFRNRFKIYPTDWGFNQLVFASAVFVFFTNLLPGITFASDLYTLTGRSYGAIEVVFSTGLCGVIFAL